MRLFTYTLVSLISTFTLAVSPPPNNARSLSLGGASCTYLNAYGIQNNVATLAFSAQEISLNAANRFGLSEYSSAMLVANIATKSTNIGFAYQLTPFANFAAHKIQLATAKKLGEKVAAGISLNYHLYNSTNPFYQNSSLFTFNAGLYYQINEKLNAGFSLFNPNRTLLSEAPTERKVANYRLGIDYSIAENLTLYSDFVQASAQRPDINAGLELAKDNYTVRGGFGLNQLVAIGFGWKTNSIQLDVAAAYHNQLGLSPSLNVSYAF